MATLHRIVLAIAGSWNNETSSPAPQGGNRALRNKTNALASAFAERQEPNSAKTPPILNRIGKGIGKFWIPILLVTATLLTQAPIEQVEAASASTNQITRQTPSYTHPNRDRSTTTTNRVIVPTYRPSTNRVSRPPLRRTTPSPNQVSRQIPNRNKVIPPRTPSRTTPRPRLTTPSRSTPQQRIPIPRRPPNPGSEIGRGIGESLLANYIYDALGNKVAVSSSMDGTMVAVPAVNQRSGSRRLDTVDGSNYTSGPDNDSEEDSFDANHKWTEYYKVYYDNIVDNPHYDSDNQYSEKYRSEEGLGVREEGGAITEYGDEFLSAGDMVKNFGGARGGTRIDDEGFAYTIWTKKGKWLWNGESQKIYCEHELVDAIQTPNDSRLANGQTYKVGVKWKLERLSNYGQLPGETGHGFIFKSRDSNWRYQYLTGDNEFSATSASRKSVTLLEKNSQICDGPDALGRSRLYWEGIQETVGSSPIFGLGGTTRTRWERRQLDELKEDDKKKKGGN